MRAISLMAGKMDWASSLLPTIPKLKHFGSRLILKGMARLTMETETISKEISIYPRKMEAVYTFGKAVNMRVSSKRTRWKAQQRFDIPKKSIMKAGLKMVKGMEKDSTSTQTGTNLMANGKTIRR